MQWYLGLLMALIGAYMLISGVLKANHAPYKWLHARAALLWKDNAHMFLAVSGGIILVLGALGGFGTIW